MQDDSGNSSRTRLESRKVSSSAPPLRRAATLLAAALLWSSAAAQAFSGTYLGATDVGQVTVVIQATGEELTGSLTASGIQFALEGFVQDGVGVGLAYTAEGTVGFEAYLEGDTLGLYLFEMDAAGAPIVESVVELIMTRQAAAPGSVLGSLGVGGVATGSAAGAGSPNTPTGGAPTAAAPPGPANHGAPRKQLGNAVQAPTSPAPPAPAGPVDQVLATGTYGNLTQDNAAAFIEALEFVLAEIGYAYTFTDAERAEALRAIAGNYPTMAQMDQVVLSQAREIWQRVQANWAHTAQSDQREFALGVLILAFGEQTVNAWVGQGGGGQGGGSCTTFEDCTSNLVDEQTWTDTTNAQGCWAAAGCGGYDPSTNTFDYGSY